MGEYIDLLMKKMKKIHAIVILAFPCLLLSSVWADTSATLAGGTCYDVKIINNSELYPTLPDIIEATTTHYHHSPCGTNTSVYVINKDLPDGLVKNSGDISYDGNGVVRFDYFTGYGMNCPPVTTKLECDDLCPGDPYSQYECYDRPYQAFFVQPGYKNDNVKNDDLTKVGIQESPTAFDYFKLNSKSMMIDTQDGKPLHQQLTITVNSPTVGEIDPSNTG